MSAWQPIETAPRDGTKVDLWYPYPRCRVINCYFSNDRIWGKDGQWLRREPAWKDNALLPESEWMTACFPNMVPSHWMLSPDPPEAP